MFYKNFEAQIAAKYIVLSTSWNSDQAEHKKKWKH